MKITWLGQAGLLFDVNGKKILIDPYLSNSVAKLQPQNYRRQPIDESFLNISPDVIIVTHCRDSYYGFPNEHINEKGFQIIAKSSIRNMQNILIKKVAVELEAERCVPLMK